MQRAIYEQDLEMVDVLVELGAGFNFDNSKALIAIGWTINPYQDSDLKEFYN